MRVFYQLLTVFFATIFSASTASAASSEWQDLGGGKGRLLAVLNPATNLLDAAVEIRLEPGWSTYWRNPGSAGIPPRFDFSQSRGFLPMQIDFPAPSLISADNNPYAGYKNTVLFPITGQIDLAQRADLKLDLLIGVCATVCIPAQANFKINFSELQRSDPQASQLLALAKRAVPETVPSSQIVSDKQLVEGKKLHIKLMSDDSGKDAFLFVEGPSSWYLTPAKHLKSDDATHLFEVDLSRAPDGSELLAEPLKFTYKTGSKSFEFTD